MNNRNRANNGPGQQKSQNHQFQRTVQNNQAGQNQQQSQSGGGNNQSKQNNSNNTPPKAMNQVNSIKLLEQYFSQNNLGELTFKTASMEVKSGGGGPNQKNGN